MFGSNERSSDDRIGLMHREFGRFDGCRCRNCPHMDVRINKDETRVYYKCLMFGDTDGHETDWRCGNIACGAFRIAPEDAVRRGMYGEVFRIYRDALQGETAEQIPGQVCMAV